MFRIWILFKSLWNVNQAYSEPCYRPLFRHIQAYWEPCYRPLFRHIQAYSELCHIYENLLIFRTLTYLKPNSFSEPSQRFKIDVFAKIVKNYHHLPKVLQFKSLTGLWIHQSLSKYSSTCRVTLRYVFYDTYSEAWLS